MIVPVRRWGSNRVHLAEVPESSLAEVTILGSTCRAILTSTATVCGSLLHASDDGSAGGTIIVMQKWMGLHPRSRHDCSRCRRLRPGFQLDTSGNG